EHYVTEGKYDVGTIDAPSLVAGTGISNAAGVDMQSHSSNLVLYLPNRKAKNFSSLDAMHSFEVRPSGIFSVQQEFDDKYAFTNLAFVQYMLDLEPNQYNGIEISVVKQDDIPKIQQQLQKISGSNLIVQTRYQQNQS